MEAGPVLRTCSVSQKCSVLQTCSVLYQLARRLPDADLLTGAAGRACVANIEFSLRFLACVNGGDRLVLLLLR